jgi:oligopeptide/dipeptide ABC transporter ATP-binding protein
MPEAIVEGSGLSKTFLVGGGLWGGRKSLRALDNVSITVLPGEALSIIGESGCGKSTLGKILAGIIRPDQGSVLIDGKNPKILRPAEASRLRLEIQIIQQDPYGSLNPRRRVFNIIGDPLIRHRLERGPAVKRRVTELLESVGLGEAVISKFPYQLSGGQRQRVGIARAFAVNPRLVVADEAVSMIDVSLRATVLGLMRKLQAEQGVAYVFITHDLALARYFSRRYRSMVMYAGQVIELGQTLDVIDRPLHPYTAMLREAVPEPNPERRKPLQLIPKSSDLPDLTISNSGCLFVERCPFAIDQCREEIPVLEGKGDPTHFVACHRAPEWTAAIDRAREA